MILRLAVRQFGRELRSGELRLLLAALVVAVAAVAAVAFFADRVRLALDREARQLIGGDLVLRTDQPPAAAVIAEAKRRGLATTETRIFPSMVFAGERLQLADIKAVGDGYPLRGRLGADGRPADGGPRPGSVWIDERLAAALQVKPGDRVGLGSLNLPVAALLTAEPDRGINFLALAPRLMMHLDDLPASRLEQPGARIAYRLLAAGDNEAVAGFRRWLERGLVPGQRIEDSRDGRPEIRGALDRAERFLGLATALTVVLSAVAVALAARRYLQRHLDTCAMLRCLGLGQRQLLVLHALVFAGVAVVAALIGSALGFAAHHALLLGVRGLIDFTLPAPGWRPLFWGFAVAAVLMAGFALPPLLRLSSVPTLRVLRRELGPPPAGALGGHAAGIGLLAGLVFVVAGDARLGALTAVGFVLALGIFALLARLTIELVGRLRRGSSAVRHGLATLRRHALANTLQAVALAAGLMAMLILTVTQNELLAAWQRSIPADAPNRFVINIQPEQRAGVDAALAATGIVAELQPMVRARLASIAGRPVGAASYPEDERAQRLVAREFNLSWRADSPPGNRIVEGRWFAPGETGVASVEEGLARTLGIRLGDELVFTLAGKEVSLRVGSLRKLDWDSMRVNFFVIAPPGALDAASASYITSFRAPADGEFANRLLAAYPNLTLIDVDALLAQLRGLVGQVAAAVRFIFLFTLLAGAAVLYAALLSAMEERRHEFAVMRALGASRAQLRVAMLTELAVVGATAGFIAAGGAMLLGQAVARQVFQVELPIAIWLPFVAAAGGAGLTMAAGWLAVTRLAATPPLAALRAAG